MLRSVHLQKELLEPWATFSGRPGARLQLLLLGRSLLRRAMTHTLVVLREDGRRRRRRRYKKTQRQPQPQQQHESRATEREPDCLGLQQPQPQPLQPSIRRTPSIGVDGQMADTSGAFAAALFGDPRASRTRPADGRSRAAHSTVECPWVGRQMHASSRGKTNSDGC